MARFRPPSVLLTAGAGAVLLALLLLAGALIDRWPFAADRWLLVSLRRPGMPAVPIGPGWLLPVARDITALGSPALLTIASLAAVALLLAAGRVRIALVTTVAVIGGAALETLVKLVVARGRPTIVPHLVEVSGNSFPSGHATNSAIVYLTIAALAGAAIPDPRVRRVVRVLAVLLVGAIGLTRLYLGVHWPSDVTAGWCLGTFWALGWWRVGERWR